MGFRPLLEAESISARFHSVGVYTVQGFTIDEPAIPAQSGSIAGRSYQLALGASLNAVCRVLVNEDFDGDEGEWRKKQNAPPPYLIVHFGPTQEHQFAGTHVKLDGPTIRTYNGFTSAREELRVWREDVLPSLLAGLATSFSTCEHAVKFLEAERAFYGVTSDSQTVLDFQDSGWASGYVSSRLSADEAVERVGSAMSIAAGIRPKVARFFHLGLNEDDPLKRFLYFFLAIEIETHATFSTIDHAQHMSALVHPPARAAITTQEFFNAQRERWTNLRDRFVWCVLCTWSHLSDPDVQDFKRLKKIRDDIAHGSVSIPPAGATELAEKLATKLHLPVLAGN
jgi:hypothetical protein